MIPLHLERIRGGHDEATISLCDALRSGARGPKKSNLATVTIVDPLTGKGKKNSWVVWKVIQQFALSIGKCSVRCSVEFSVFLDPRRKRMSEDDCIGGGMVLHTMSVLCIEELGHRSVRNVAQYSGRTLAPAPAPAPGPAPAPAPGLAIPARTLPRVPSVIEQRRLARLAAAGHGSSSHGAQGGGGTTCDTPRYPSTGTN